MYMQQSSGQIHSPLRGAKVDYSIRLSSRPASLCSLTPCRYDNPMPELTLSPQSGTKNLPSAYLAYIKGTQNSSCQRVLSEVVFGLSRFGQLPLFSGFLSGFLFGLRFRLQALVWVLGQSLNKSGREYIGRGPPTFADVLTRPFLKFFRCSNDFIMQKVYFSRLMRD
jgi:hypothetical protein